jgi:hypothetical protein
MNDTLFKGINIKGAVVNMAAAGAANAAVIFTRSTAFQGTRSFKLKKIMMHDNGTGGTQVHIGTGVGGAFAAVIPGIHTVNNMDLEVPESELPAAELFANLTAYPDAVGGSSIDITVEVEEIGA